jgi:flagellar protein FlaG
MDGIANVAKQQQTQVNVAETQGRAVEQTKSAQPKTQNIVKEMQDAATEPNRKINSEDQVKELVGDLNKALEPLNTDLKFGVDTQDIFYVSVVDTKTNKMIRRFPAEQAQDFLPKMKEVTGILFDYKG